MHLINCLHPITISVYGEKKIVPCGTCEYCRNARNTSMSERIRLEMQTHKYNIFGTLTYANMFLPKMCYSEDLHGFYIPDDDFRNTNDEGLFVYYPWLNKASKSYVMSCMAKHGFIPRLNKKDFQDFFKRVRRKIEYHITNKLIEEKKITPDEKEQFKISYALCGEYGPTTYRPHAHFIVSFDRPEIAECITEILRSSWYYGSSSYRWSSDARSARYVAQYVSSTHNIPDCFKPKEFRTFLLVSKSHPLGLNKVTEEEIQRVFNSASATCVIFDNDKARHVELPLWPSLERRLFPQFTGFKFIPNRLRVSIVGTALKCFSFEVFKQIMTNILFVEHTKKSPDIRFYREFLLMVYKNRFDRVDNALKSIWYASRIIQRNMHKYCVNSVSDYIDIINKYIDNVEKYKLKEQLKFEEDYLPNHPFDYIYLDIENHDEKVYFTSDVSELISRVHSSIESSKKNRRKNEYLAHHPDCAIIRKYDEFLEGFSPVIY